MLNAPENTLSLMDKEDKAADAGQVYEPHLNPLSFMDFMTIDYQQPPCLLHPILPYPSLSMLYAERGVGKTMLAIGIAMLIANGKSYSEIGPWTAPHLHNVLYIDAEMSFFDMRSRLKMMQGILSFTEPDSFRILSSALGDDLPDLATEEGQCELEQVLGDSTFLVLDNLSTLMKSGTENEAESWSCVQQWLMRLRQRGVSVLLVHHAGKSGQQRGTSRREDILDTVIALRRPKGYSPKQGARFEVHLEKARSVFGEDAEPFELALKTNENGVMQWLHKPLDKGGEGEEAETLSPRKERYEQALRMLEAGEPIKAIARETGLARQTVYNLKEKQTV